MQVRRNSIDTATISTDEDFDSSPAGIGADGRFRVICNACEKRLRVRLAHAGKTVKCPKCKGPVNVPVVLPDGTISATGSSISLDIPLPPKARKPHLVFLYVALDVVLSGVLGWLIGHAFWH